MNEEKFKRLKEFLPSSVYRKNINHIETLIHKVKTKNVSLVVGAGVSQSVGLPGWNRLLNMLFGLLFSDVSIFEKNVNSSDELTDQMQFLIRAQEICSPSKLKEKFKEVQNGKYKVDGNKLDISSNIDLLQLAEALFLATPSIDNDDSTHNNLFCSMIQYILSSSLDMDKFTETTTLYQTAMLILKTEINTIITYNYDNFLEYAMEDLKEKFSEFEKTKIKYHTYEKYNRDRLVPNVFDVHKNIKHIFHVHGYIDIVNPDGEKANNLILSESHYNIIEKEVYNWVNSVQINTITSQNTLFVGFSANDYNFKRIIKNCGNMTLDHYIIFNLNDYVEKVFPNINIDDIIANKDEYAFEMAILNNLLYCLSLYWEKYNIHPIWCFVDDIPHLLEELYI